MKHYIPLIFLALGLAQFSFGQTNGSIAKADIHTKTRAQEIVKKLGIKEPEKEQQTQLLLVDHFAALQEVFDERTNAMQTAKNNTKDKELADGRARTAWDAANGKLNKLYAAFLGKISNLLNQGEIEALKDHMTEGGLQREYNHYLAMFPNLLEQQKLQVTAYLKEARENAMNAATAQNRIEWFIKFRGRANNYLAAAGYDLRKATENLEASRSAAQKK